MNDTGPTRRELLGASAAAGACAWLGLPAKPAPTRRTRRVVLVVFGGGVRSQETIQAGHATQLLRMADEGVLFDNVVVRNDGHYGAALNIFTGRFEAFGIRENARTSHPTLFEYLRKGAGLAATDVWLSTSGGAQETNYAHGTHTRYGRRYGANLIGGEGLFNPRLRQLLAGPGGLARPDAEQERLLAALRAAVRTPLPSAGVDGPANDPQAVARIERYILDELRGDAAGITGPGANDAKALHVARNLLGLFRPRLLAVTLRNPDVAHGSFNDYVTVIRRNDAGLGRLMDAVRADEELRQTTAVFVLPEFGRDRDLNARRGLDHGDGSPQLLRVSLVAWGPDFRGGRRVGREVRSIDVCPTIAELFDVRAQQAQGRSLLGLLS